MILEGRLRSVGFRTANPRLRLSGQTFPLSMEARMATRRMTRFTARFWAIAGISIASAQLHDANAQGYGAGVSPGRAAYRPSRAWNNGPFYTTRHLDPWAPRQAVSTSHIYTEALAPPYTNQPRARFREYDSGRGTLYPYQNGFSPFSGYSDWYRRTYGVVPDERNLAAAATSYFRSSPIPADPRYLAPAVGQAIFSPTAAVFQPLPTERRSTAIPGPSSPKVYEARPRAVPASPRRTLIYRQGVQGPR